MKRSSKHEELVNTYFKLVGDLRSGSKEAVDELVDMWDPDGTFEFAGAPPVTGTFRGRNAIHVLYKNRLAANGMSLALDGKKQGSIGDVELGLVSTKPHRTRVMDNKIVAGWSTEIGTTKKQGFRVSGSHTFTFRGDKIYSLKVVVSPKADEASNMDLASLGVDDIGRLSLAAWAVV